MKPTVPEVLPAVQALYARDSAGCCLHVVLDDRNVRDCFVDSCIENAVHDECKQIAIKLRQMSTTQRRKLCSLKRGL